MQGLQIPKVMAFAFLRNERLNSGSYADTFPHPPDSDNTRRQTLQLPQCWYGNQSGP